MRYDLYVVTDEAIACGRSHAEIARYAVAGGADAIQLRDKVTGCRELVAIAREIAGITRAHGALFIVNDRLDVAIAGGADGVHIGQGDIRIDVARQIAPEGFIIGVSVGSVREAFQAQEAGADYVALSPVFNTTSKDDAGQGHGLGTLTEIRTRGSIPLVAIGGIGPANVCDVIRAGADGVAVISAVVGRPDICAAAHELKSRIVQAKSANLQNLGRMKDRCR